MPDMTERTRNAINTLKGQWTNSPYYTNAERHTDIFWDPQRWIFRTLFDQLDLSVTVELACGHGRHAERAAPLCGHLTLIDLLPENIEFCRKRLAGRDNLSFIVNSGADLPVETGSVTAIYCYDAMVHFPLPVVDAYMAETARVLRPGGMALYHHSNLRTGTGADQTGKPAPHARSMMNCEDLNRVAEAAGLEVRQQVVIDWGGTKAVDGVTLLVRA